MINKEQENDSLKNQDKESIIIDGVDVRKCKSYNPLGNYNCGGCRKCEDNSNCYFKQLARKTQECEQKEKELLSNEKIINKLMKEVDELKQECEELKKEQLEIKKYLGISHKSILERLEELQERRDELSEKNISYEQALDEIKSICNKTCEICQIFEKCDKEFSNCKNAKMLNIINKAKGRQ